MRIFARLKVDYPNCPRVAFRPSPPSSQKARWAVWAVSLKVENGLDFQLPKLPINKSVDNFMPARSSMCWCARSWPAMDRVNNCPNCPLERSRAFLLPFLFRAGRLAGGGGRQGRAVRDCDWHGSQTIFCNTHQRNKIF